MKNLCIVVIIIFTAIVGNEAHGTIIFIPNDYPTVQEGINAAVNGDTVCVADGLYSEHLGLQGKRIVLASYFILDGDTTHISATIIDGGGYGSVIDCSNHETFHTAIVGLTIQNGNTSHGGGISCWNSSPRIMYNRIINNTAVVGGGIACSADSHADIMYNIISNNTGQGGGIICGGSSPRFVRNLWYDNVGGAIELQSSDAGIIHNTICHNDVGIKSLSSAPYILNSIVYFNHQQQIDQGTDTIRVNYCDVQGGWPPSLVPFAQESYAEFIWDDIKRSWTKSTTPKVYLNFYPTISTRDTGNIDADPLFADTTNRDYHLTWANYPVPDSTKSPCIDAGDPNYGNDPDSTIVDIGVYYFYQSASVKENAIAPITKAYLCPSVFSGGLQLPTNKVYKIFDITGREVKPHLLAPGIYFIEVEGVVTQKVIKVR